MCACAIPWDTVLEKCREYYRERDLDGDGKLSRHEFLKMMEFIGMDLQANELGRAFDVADANRNGTISFKEFIDEYTGELRNNPTGSNETNTTSDKVQRSYGTSNTNPSPEEKLDNNNNNNRKFTEKEMVECCKYFWESDENGDGKLSFNEFTKLMGALEMNVSTRGQNKAFRAADLNKDKLVSFQEFVQTFLCGEQSSSTSSGKQIRENLLKGYKCDNYFLSKQECLQLMKMLGNDLDEKRLNRVMYMMDKNKDGKITWNEFCEFLDLDL